MLKLHENIGAGLQLIFDRLQEANPETLAGVFGTVQWANKQILPEERLLAVLDVFTSLKLDPDSVTHDLLGNGYEYLLKNFADESGKKAGEFFTPRAVVRLMVQLLDPKAGESIYDPTFGSGGMLVESLNQVRAHVSPRDSNKRSARPRDDPDVVGTSDNSRHRLAVAGGCPSAMTASSRRSAFRVLTRLTYASNTTASLLRCARGLTKAREVPGP
ncbi:MAG: class I SAM-dependent DNA methyltransferase [Solirubrobacteraceae bacterium]